MKICIPTLGERGLNENVGEHFGRVPTYTIINLENDDVKVIQNTSHHTGGQGYPPEIMANEGVNVMICRGLGRRAISMFEDIGIEVYIGATGTVKNAINDFKQGKLQKANISDACGQHAFRDSHRHGTCK
jgi:predicted Fe-Mo cluster-binding NifX family protein